MDTLPAQQNALRKGKFERFASKYSDLHADLLFSPILFFFPLPCLPDLTDMVRL